MTARQEVLARIAEAHRAAPPPELAYEQITRDYRTSSDLDHHELTERLIDRLVDYKALVRRRRPRDLPRHDRRCPRRPRRRQRGGAGRLGRDLAGAGLLDHSDRRLGAG